MEENRRKALDEAENIYILALEKLAISTDDEDRVDLLARRQRDAIAMHNGIGNSDGASTSSSQEDEYVSSAVLLGSSIAVKNAVCPITLPMEKRIPPYTSWVFLDRYVISNVFCVLF